MQVPEGPIELGGEEDLRVLRIPLFNSNDEPLELEASIRLGFVRECRDEEKVLMDSLDQRQEEDEEFDRHVVLPPLSFGLPREPHVVASSHAVLPCHAPPPLLVP